MKIRFSLVSLVALLVLGLFLSLVPQKANAQARPSQKQNVISINPLGLLYDFPLMIQYEAKNGPLNSWAGRLYYWPPTATGYKGFGAGGAYRFFIADSRALTGLSVAPAADLFIFSNSLLSKTATVIWIGGDLGYKWIFDQISVEPMFGLRIGFGPAEGVSYATGFKPIIAINAGYAW